MINEMFKFCFKIIIKWNLTNSHAARLKSAEYKIHVIKDRIRRINLTSHNK